MTRHVKTLPPDYFEAMFQGTADPWDLESSSYEKAKYDHSISALGGRTYARGLEVGCAKGVLTQRLAQQCRTLLAIDVSDTALEAALARCAQRDNIAFACMNFPHHTPRNKSFDLMIFSEVVYYWDDADIARAGQWIARHLVLGGHILLVHWTGETDYPQSGDEAVVKLGDALRSTIAVITKERHKHYRLDLWCRSS